MIPLISLALLVRRRRQKEIQKRNRRYYMHPMLENRIYDGEFVRLVSPLNNLDQEKFKNYFRMSRVQFDYLLNKITPLVSHPRNHRTPISVEERLSVTLRHLASGDSFTSLAYSYRLGKSSIVGIVPEVCKALWEVLSKDELPIPTEEDWKTVADGFWRVWGFPNCLGAIDGKHCVIKAPPKSGSKFYNYKGTFSLVLLAVVSYDYRFLFVDVGSYGSQGDSTIFQESKFGRQLKDGKLKIPEPALLPGSDKKCPHVFIGDSAFALTESVMKPFSRTTRDSEECIYNYRLSRARRVVENAFGILASRWRILSRPMETSVSTTESIILAAIVLHNFLRLKDCETDASTVLGGMRTVVPSAAANPSSQSAREIRARFQEFFNSEAGALPWQENIFIVGTNRKGRED